MQKWFKNQNCHKSLTNWKKVGSGRGATPIQKFFILKLLIPENDVENLVLLGVVQ